MRVYVEQNRSVVCELSTQVGGVGPFVPQGGPVGGGGGCTVPLAVHVRPGQGLEFRLNIRPGADEAISVTRISATGDVYLPIEPGPP